MRRSPLTSHLWAIGLAAVGSLALGSASGWAQTWRGAHDPKSFVAPPLGAKEDGFGGQVRIDADFFAAAAALRSSNPAPQLAAEEVIRVGEVLVIPGDAESVSMVGSRFGIAPTALKIITRKAIAFAGDNFDIITLWVTFDDRGTDALAYALNVRNEVSGLGRRLRLQDLSESYGSKGRLRTVVNMKAIGLSSPDDRPSWNLGLQIWGQETGHRFMAFMDVRDPRSGRPSDLLLGRDCAHFDWFVDTQGSVQDGLAWTDNRNGTFTWTERSVRYGNLDLYGMGLIPADEVPPFFSITDIPGFTRPRCEESSAAGIPAQRTVSGQRLDFTIDDVVAANGLRLPAASPGYMRELQVVVTRPNESVLSDVAQKLAQRIDQARLWWEEWARAASSNRLLVCTRSTDDCGDARSDVVGVATVAPAIPALGPVPFQIEVANIGTRVATGLKAWVEVRVAGQSFSSGAPVALADLAPGATASPRFSVPLGALACGTEVDVLARTQSDFHYNRMRLSLPLGVETLWSDGFETESGWMVNADGTDTGQGASWERGTPQISFLADKNVQVDAAVSGTSAFVTGLMPVEAGLSGGFVKQGRVTLTSPLVPSAQARSPSLRYHVSFSGMRSSGGGGIESSAASYLAVEVRPFSGGDAGAGDAWREIDRLSDSFAAPWAQRVVALPTDLDLTRGLQFRFVAADDNVDVPGGVEAAIDDLALTSTLAGCKLEDGGCGCRLAGQPHRKAAVAWWLVLPLAISLRLGSRWRCAWRRRAWRST